MWPELPASEREANERRSRHCAQFPDVLDSYGMGGSKQPFKGRLSRGSVRNPWETGTSILDMEGVRGSIPLAPTILRQDLLRNALRAGRGRASGSGQS